MDTLVALKCIAQLLIILLSLAEQELPNKLLLDKELIPATLESSTS